MNPTKLLCECDAILVAGAKELEDVIAGLPAEVGLDAAEQQIDRRLSELAAALARRNEVLSAPL